MTDEFPSIIIDYSALKDLFEGTKAGKEIVRKLKERKDLGKPVVVVTTIANFLRAVWLADPEVKINDIQKTLSFLTVMNSGANFMDEQAVINEIIKIAETISKFKDGNKR